MDYRDLPYDAEIEYLESTGTQYIDTGIVGSSELSVVLKCYYPASSASLPNTGFILASRVANKDRQYGIIHSYASNFRYGNTTSNSWANPEDRVLIFDNTESHNILKVFDTDNNLVTTLTATAKTFNNNLNIVLFGINNNGNILKSSNRIYSLKMYEGTTLVRDYISVRVGNVGYLFDKVSKQLFGNSGTEDFVLGSDVAPGRYAEEIAFLESWGNQYIDTGIKPSNDTKIELKCLYCKSGAGLTNYGSLIGADDRDNAYILNHSAVANFTYGLEFSNNFANPQTRLLTFDSTASPQNMRVYDEGGSLVTTLTCLRGVFEVNQNLYLFATNRSGTPVYGSNRILYCKIYDGDTLVRDYVPVEYNGIGYMYDKVSGLFFDNKGTGKFLFGSIAKACARSYTRRQLMAENYVGHAPAGYKWVDYIKNTSTAFINTGVAANVISRIECSMRMNTLRDNGNANNYFGNQGSQLFLKVLTNNRFHINWHSTSNVYDFNNNVWNQRITIICDYPSNSATIGITTKSMRAQAITETSNLLIMRRGTNTTSLNYSGFMTCWRFKVYGTDGILIRDYVPIMRLSDSKYGLWDKVNKTFNISPNNVLFNGGNDQ